MIKTKKYNYPNMLFCNKFTYNKLQQFAHKLMIIRLHLELGTLKDFTITINEELENDKMVFYVNKKNDGLIIEYDLKDLLK